MIQPEFLKQEKTLFPTFTPPISSIIFCALIVFFFDDIITDFKMNSATYNTRPF